MTSTDQFSQTEPGMNLCAAEQIDENYSTDGKSHKKRPQSPNPWPNASPVSSAPVASAVYLGCGGHWRTGRLCAAAHGM